MTAHVVGPPWPMAAITMPEAAILAAALDCLGAAVFLVEASSRIVHANASARVLIGRRSVLRSADGRLIACDAGSARVLKASIADVGGGEGRQRVAVPLPAGDGEHRIAHVLALEAAKSSGAKPAVGAIVLVHEIALQLPSSSEALATFYGLTAGELRVLEAIVQVGGVPETAVALGIGEATVKTHLHRLYGKTGATRQADLVKLVAGLASPVAAGRPEPVRVGHADNVQPAHLRPRHVPLRQVCAGRIAVSQSG